MAYINPYKLFVGSFLPNWLLERNEVSDSAKLVYARLAQHAGKSGDAFPHQETLGKEIGKSERQVKRLIGELKKLKLIEAHKIGLTGRNHYLFLDHPWMKGYQRAKYGTSQVPNMAPPLKRIIEKGEATRIDRILLDPAKEEKLSKPLNEVTKIKFGRK